MKIAIDLRPLQIGHQNRGIGAHLLNLLQNLQGGENISYIFLRYDYSEPLTEFNVQVPGNFEEVLFKKYVFSKNPIGLAKYALGNLIPKYGNVLRLRPDVFLQLDYLLGGPSNRSCKTVVVAHDLIPFRFKQIYLPSWKKYYMFRQFKFKSRVRLALRAWYYERKYKNGANFLRKADHIISVSENTKKDLVEILSVNPDKIEVVYSAPSFRQDKGNLVVKDSLKSVVDSLNKNYICYIGGTDLRRQIDELVFAFNLYNSRNDSLNLVLCGNEFEKGSTEINPKMKYAIETSSYKNSIFTFGKITEAEKQYILSHTKAFVFPTLYEGFGLPVLEAMRSGAPVLSYKNSSVLEIAKDSIDYSGEGGYNIYLSLCELLEKPTGAKNNKLQKAKRVSENFDWVKTAERTWQIVRKEAAGSYHET